MIELDRKFKVYLILIFGFLVVAGMLIFYPRRSEPNTPNVEHNKDTVNLPMEGFLVALDPGHGGKDGGSEYGDLQEKTINLAIAFQVQRIMKGWGSKVVLTREGDYEISVLYPDERTRQRRDLLARVKVAQEENADALVSIHVNAASSNMRGPMVFYQKNVDESKALAANVLRELQQVARHQQQDLIGANYFILKQAAIPAVLVEVGFITNAGERAKLVSEEYQRRLATAIAWGVRNYLLPSGTE